VEKICDRIAILAQGELICVGTLDELLGVATHYQVRGKGGNIDILQRWVKELAFEDDRWYGELKGEPQEFIASLRLMGAQLIEITLARSSLEEFFMQQLRQRGIESSH
jgi:ABC-2 type transport system ATP-binding protein